MFTPRMPQPDPKWELNNPKEERLNSQEILSLVEWLTSGAEEDPIKQTNSDKLLLQIYRITHSHREDACCYEVHKDWREESLEIYKKNKHYF